MIRTNKFLTIFVTAIVLIFAGCDANSTEDTAMLMLDFEPKVGTQTFSTGTTYTLNGQALTFTSGRIYLSEIALIQEDGTEIQLAGPSITGPAENENEETVTHSTNDKIVLAKHDAGEHSYHLGEVPAGTYRGVRARLGITGLTNNLDPTQLPSDHALAQQLDRNNHWSWSAGYIYLRMDGYLDLDGDGTVEETEDGFWDIHVGTPAFSEMFTFDRTFSLAGGVTQELHIIVDYAKLIETVDFSDPDQRRCHTRDNLPVAEKVKAQYASAIELHGVHVADQHGEHSE